MSALDFYRIPRVTARQSSTSIAWADVASIPSTQFVPGKKYFLRVTAVLDSLDIQRAALVQMVHGSTVFSSKHQEEPDSTTSKILYSWWAVWVAEESEDVKLQLRAESNTFEVGIVDIEMARFNLSDDLEENVDWFHHEVSASTLLGTSESATDNASVTVIPAVAGQKWAIFSRAAHSCEDTTISHQSRLLRTGEAAETLSEVIKEAEDPSHNYVLAQMQCLTLGAVSNTFTEKSLLSGVGTIEARSNSAVFALNLSKFKVAQIARTAGKTDLSATDFGTLLDTVTITPTVAGYVWCEGFWVHDVGTAGIHGKTRLQVGNADDPAGQTASAYALEEAHDARDQVGMWVGTLSSKTAAAHTYDMDASTEAATAGRGGMYRSLFAVTMELADESGPPPATGEVTHVFSTKLPLGTETTGGQVTIDALTEEFDHLEIVVTSRSHHSGLDFVTCEDSESATNPWIRMGVGPSRKSYLFTKKATPQSAGLVVTIADAINSCAAVLSGYRGAWRGGNPITNLSILPHAGGVETRPGFVPEHGNSMISGAVFNTSNDVNVTVPACTNPGALTIRDERLSSGGDDCAVIHFSAPQVGGPTATGDFSWTQGDLATQTMVWAIRPEPITAPPEEQTAALCKAVAFNIGTGIAGSTKEVPIGFEGEAVNFFAIGRTEAGDAGGLATAKRLIGFAANCAGTIKNRCGANFSEHNKAAGSFNAHRMGRSDACIVLLDTAGNVAGRARLTSFTSTSFILTIDVQFASDIVIFAEVYGGTDATNCEIVTVITPIAGTLPVIQDVTGLGFTCTEGQAVGFLLGVGQTTDNAGSADAQLGFGAFVKANDGARWTGATDTNPTATLTRRHCSRGRPWGSLDATATAFAKLIQFAGWIPDGFRLQHDQISASAELIYCLVIKGGRWAIADALTSRQENDVELGSLGIGTPVGGLLVSGFGQVAPADTSVFTTDMCCFGVFSSPTDRYVVAQRDRNNVAPSQVSTRLEHDQVYASLSPEGEVTGTMDFQGFEPDKAVFHQDLVEAVDAEGDSVQRFFWSVLFGRSAGFEGDPTAPHRYLRMRTLTVGQSEGPVVNQLELHERTALPGAVGSTSDNPAKLADGTSHLRLAIVANWNNADSPEGETDIDFIMMTLPAGHVSTLPGERIKQLSNTFFDSEGILKPSVLQSDGISSLPLVKGILFGTARHGDAVSFATQGRTFRTIPLMEIEGGIPNQPGSVWLPSNGLGTPALPDTTKPQHPDVGAEDLDLSGFKMRARLRQKYTLANETLGFFGGPLNFVDGNEALVPGPNAPATDDRYTVNGISQARFRSIDGNPYAVIMTYVIETTDDNGATPWDIRANGILIFETITKDFVTRSSAWQHVILVAGFDNHPDNQLRVRFTGLHEDGNGEYVLNDTWIKGLQDGVYPNAGLTFTYGIDDMFASKTPGSDDLVRWKATGYLIDL